MRPRSRIAWLAGAVVVATLAYASPAAAVRAFQPPQVIAPGSEPVVVAVDGAGNALVAFSSGGDLLLVARPAGGDWQAPELVAGAAGGFLGFDAAGNAVLVWSRINEAKTYMATRPPGATSFGPAEVIATGVMWGEFELVSSGAALFVWRRWSDWGTSAAYRPPGGSFERHDFAAGSEIPGAGLGADGTATATWHVQPQQPQIAVRPAGAAAWQDPIDLGPPQDGIASPTSAVDADGNVLAVWFGGGVNVRFRPAGAATSFGSPDRLGPGTATSGSFAPTELAFDGAGDATLLWLNRETGSDGSVRTRLYGALRPAGGEFAPPVAISPPGQDVDWGAQLAVAPDGSAVAVWRGFDGGRRHPPNWWEPSPDGPIYSAVRTDGVWGAAQRLSPQGRQLAMVGTGGGTTVTAWTRTFWTTTEEWFANPCSQLEVSVLGDGSGAALDPTSPACDAEEPSPGGGAPPDAGASSPGDEAPPSGPAPGSVPSSGDAAQPLDGTPPAVVIGGSRKQRVLARRRVDLTLGCDERCSGLAEAVLTTKPGRGDRSKRAKIALRGVSFSASPGRAAPLRFVLPRSLAARLRKLLNMRGSATLAVRANAKDASGRAASAKATVRLVR